MEIKIMDLQSQTLKPAITITANRDRVVDVKWYIKTFSNNDYYNNYSLYFFDIFENKMIKNYPEVLYNPDIKDIKISYICPENSMRAEPYWIIRTEEQDVYLRMQGKGD
jgi:penicillin-binding protein-related factor A (putative recombinase)